MSKFSIDLILLQDSIKSLDTVASEYTECVESLGKMSKYFNCEGYRDFEVAINNICKQALDNLEGMEQMGIALSDIWNQYTHTEKFIIGDEGVTAETQKKDDTWKSIGDIEELRDIEIYKIIKALGVRGILGNGALEALGEVLRGTYIKSGTANGMRYFRLMSSGMTNAECTKWLDEHLGGHWSKDLVRRLKHGEVNIYDINGQKLMRPSRFFTDVDDVRISNYLDDLGTYKGSAWKVLKNNFDVLDDFKEWKKSTSLGKVGKGLGVVGNTISIGTDVYDNCYDATTGTWNFTTETIVDTTCDVGVDIGVGAGAGAIGAAVGSFVVPPVGTVVGAGVGIAVDVVANLDFVDFNGDGKNDSLVDGTKMVVKGAADVVEDRVDAVEDWFGDLFG